MRVRATARTLRLADVRALLERKLTGRPSRANFRTGTLTVCTMVPMRSVPHRVVCLVGLDDGVFPRQGARRRRRRAGSRPVDRRAGHPLGGSPAAARRDQRGVGHRRHHVHGLQRLLRTAPATVGAAARTARRARRHHTRDRTRAGDHEHPLQPFDIRNVEKGALGVPGQPFTFDATVPAAARAAVGDRPAAPTFEPREPLQAPTLTDVTVDDLVTFFKNPVKGFFRALDYTLPWDVDGLKDDIPVGLDSAREVGGGPAVVGRPAGGIPAKRRRPHGMAPRHGATGKAGLDAGRRGCWSRATPSRRPPRVTAPASPDRTTSTSASTTGLPPRRHRQPGLLRRAGVGHLLETRSQSTSSKRGSGCSR